MVARAGVAGVVVIFATGLWLITAPFALGYARAGADWTGAARGDVITGAALAVIGLAGLLAVIAGRVGELYADARSAASLAATADRGTPGT